MSMFCPCFAGTCRNEVRNGRTVTGHLCQREAHLIFNEQPACVSGEVSNTPRQDQPLFHAGVDDVPAPSPDDMSSVKVKEVTSERLRQAAYNVKMLVGVTTARDLIASTGHPKLLDAIHNAPHLLAERLSDFGEL